MKEPEDINSIKELDYEKLGLLCGLEIHQQLNTGKLFSRSPTQIEDNSNLTNKVTRQLRFSSGEAGGVDKAVKEEFTKKKTNIYYYNPKTTSLVELDEKPPSQLNPLAFETSLKIGKLINISFLDKVEFMRKIIIDGSITSGFQRTAMIGMSGYLDTSFGKVSIDSLNLEEDSCRVLERGEDYSKFSLDRQGIPLVEISTGPHIKKPEQARELASQIGNILRSFKECKRGLGTIRQDLNVSISGGARVEIKGAQNLKLLPDVVVDEVKRQLTHKNIIDELKSRGIDKSNFSTFSITDLTDIFSSSQSKVIKSSLDNGGKVKAIKLNSFKGILKSQMQENHRFATEINHKNQKKYPSIKGLFHSDEMPAYGVTQEEVDQVKSKLSMKEEDSFILLTGKEDLITKSLENMLNIISEMIEEVPSEVRQVDPKGTYTKYLRPMPGGARMYPETDLPLYDINKSYLDELEENLPELFETKINRLTKEFGVEENKIEEMLTSYSEEEIKNLIDISGKKANALYSIIFELPKDIKKREEIEPITLDYSLLYDLLGKANEDDLSQQTIRDIFISLYKENLSKVDNLKNYLDEKGLLSPKQSDEEIQEKLKEIIENNPGAPFGALMGHAMKELGGSVDGKKISNLLKKLLDNN